VTPAPAEPREGAAPGSASAAPAPPGAGAPLDRHRGLVADAGLLTVAILWGFNFVVIKDAIADTGPMNYLLWRHIAAAVILVAVMPRTVTQIRRRDWLYGAVLGGFLFVAFATQTIGLQWTTPGKSGFITSLDIVMVPFLYWIVARRSPGWLQVGGAALATLGLGLLSLRGVLSMGRGDLLTLVGALAFAAQITATGFFAPRTRPAVLALTQIVAAAALFVVVTPFVEHVSVDLGWKGWLAILWTALTGTVYGFLIQAWAQKATTSTRAAVILGLEGLFAGITGLIFGLDALTWRFGLGAALILAGVMVIELVPRRSGEPNPVDALPRAD
jgi:drug/metabolite transporter (DMT)-like permease